MSIQSHYISLMSRQLIINKHLAPSCFIENGNFHAITKLRNPVDHNDINILDECIITNIIIGNVILNIFNATVITHSYIVEGYMPKSRMLFNASGQ